MAEGKESFILYCDLIHTVRKMPRELRGDLFLHILEYVNDLEPTTDDVMLEIAFEPIKQQLKRDLKKYERIVERNRKNGALGGRPKENQNKPKKPNGLSGNPTKPKKADSDTDSVNDIDTVSENVVIKKTIIDRKREFKNSLRPFINKYRIEMLKEFFEYWTEHGPKDRKFRAEKEKSFDVGLRLKRWARNKKEKSSAEKEKTIGRQTMDNLEKNSQGW